MKCILLCAGYATRLYPLTENFPKPLLHVGSKALLDHILDEVNTVEEIDHIYLVTNDKYANIFEDWAKSKNNIKPITVVNDGTRTNDDRLGALGDIQFVIEEGKIDDDVLLIAGDNLFTFELNKFIRYYNEKKAPVVCVKEPEDKSILKGLGVIELDENMKLVGFEEKPANPKGDYASYAEYVYPKDVLPLLKSYLDNGHSNENLGNFVAYLFEQMPVYAFDFDGECYDVGTHESLALVNEIYKNKENNQ